MQTGWFELSILTFLAWGVWGFVGKIAFNYLDWKEVYFFGIVGSLVVFLIFYLIAKPSLSINIGSYLAFIAGFIGTSATLTYYLALEQGKACIIIPLTALYPLITLILSILFLREKITFYQGVGILLAILAVFLISLER
ncbi:MAG: DMT family transporter [Candidatus Aenigmatarchaeota archaeon]